MDKKGDAGPPERRPTSPIRPGEERRPEHPSFQALVLVVGVTLLIVLLAVMTTLGGR